MISRIKSGELDNLDKIRAAMVESIGFADEIYDGSISTYTDLGEIMVAITDMNIADIKTAILEYGFADINENAEFYFTDHYSKFTSLNVSSLPSGYIQRSSFRLGVDIYIMKGDWRSGNYLSNILFAEYK